MTPLVYTYENPQKQTVHFRGYFKTYNGNELTIHTCPTVRSIKSQALMDAKKAIKNFTK